MYGYVHTECPSDDNFYFRHKDKQQLTEENKLHIAVIASVVVLSCLMIACLCLCEACFIQVNPLWWKSLLRC